MSLTFIVMMMLVGSSVVIAFVLQPSKEGSAAPVNSPVFHHRSHERSLESIRTGLLHSLNLQAEPQLPTGGVDAARKQWRTTYSRIAHRVKYAAAPEVAGYPASPDGGNSTILKCCSRASEVFMTDLGWDSWVIHPDSLAVVQCALCNSEGNPVRYLSTHSNVQGADSQDPVPYCCEPTSHRMVPVIYMDEVNSLVISSVQLTSSCGSAHGHTEQPDKQ